MATVTGLTAERMLAIEGQSVIDGNVVGNNLILVHHDGTTKDAGNVRGPKGDKGDPGTPGAPGAAGTSMGAIPGEIRMWPGSALPPEVSYGKWVWADGGVYASASYPIASGHIAAVWRTFSGASDPGGGNFRVPDLRGLTPMGMDAMPGGGRANRMSRAVSITLAGRSGEEMHTISLAEMPSHAHNGGNHAHGITDNGHYHNVTVNTGAGGDSGSQFMEASGNDGYNRTESSGTGISINASGQIIAAEGGGVAHETLQPTVFVPYIVCLNG